MLVALCATVYFLSMYEKISHDWLFTREKTGIPVYTMVTTPLEGGTPLNSGERSADEQGRFRLVDLPAAGARLFDTLFVFENYPTGTRRE